MALDKSEIDLIVKKTDDCGSYYTCCDCGDSDSGCGCAYCWSCNACESCLNDEEDRSTNNHNCEFIQVEIRNRTKYPKYPKAK